MMRFPHEIIFFRQEIHFLLINGGSARILFRKGCITDHHDTIESKKSNPFLLTQCNGGNRND